MAPLTGLVSRQGLRSGYLGRMTGRARASIGRFAHEIMGRMAALALDAGVEFLVAGRVLVARAAISHAGSSSSRSRVWIVTADARADFALFRVIGMLIRMTTRASSIRASLDVVRGMAVGALSMAGSMPS